VHELVHAYMFDLLYGRGGFGSVISQRGLFQVPLWFAEGLAEYISLGWEPNAEMFMRDGIIHGYLGPLTYAGGYTVYKQGQAAVRFLVERHGPDRLRDLLQKMKQMRNFNTAFEASMGSTVGRFNEEFDTWLKRIYWPAIVNKSSPETFARRLTDHRAEENTVFLGASISPTGDRIAYFRDRPQSTDIYLMSALDGRVLKRVVIGERSAQFENIPSMRSSLTWSPDGRFVAFVAETKARDVLYVADVEKEKVVRKWKLDLDAVYAPAWHPTDTLLAIAGVKDGRSDLYLVDRNGGMERLTADNWDERDLAWSADGRTLYFSSDRDHSVILTARPRLTGFGDYAIHSLDMATRRITRVLDTAGDDSSPLPSPDGRRLAFVSDRGGARNVYLFEPADSTFIQLTDLVGGIFSLSWSRENDRVVFTAFDEGGWDIFTAREPLSLDAVVARLRRERPQSIRGWAEMQTEVPLLAAPVVAGGAGALAPSWPDTAIAGGAARTSPPAERPPAAYPGSPFGDVARLDSLPPRIDVARAIPETRAAEPFALPESLLAQTPRRHQTRLMADYAGGGFLFNSAYGLTGSVQLSFSDFLGHHRMLVATDVFTNAIEETNLLALYNYLPLRTDYGLGVYHFKNYYFSRTTSIGEQFSRPRTFSERDVGVLGTMSFPFDRFQRVDLDLTQRVLVRTFFETDEFGFEVEAGSETRFVTAPTVSLVNDNVQYDYYGPVHGRRSVIAVSPAIPILSQSLSYQTALLDYRRYVNLGRETQLALRGVGTASFGRDPQVFAVGGPYTVRGYEDFQLVGSRVAFTNLELRFPFLQGLGVLGPLPLGFFNLRGVLFLDNAVVWNEGEKPQFTTDEPFGDRRLKALKMSFGTGVRSNIFFLMFRADVAWRTDLQRTSSPVWHVALGPDF
jgi:Tol biopolymer transport system component